MSWMVQPWASIGGPAAFKNSLQDLGAVVKVFEPFEDHHSYNQDNIDKLIKNFQAAHIKIVVTTHKDAVKLKPFIELLEQDFTLLYLLIKIEMVGNPNEFYHRIDRLL